MYFTLNMEIEYHWYNEHVEYDCIPDIIYYTVKHKRIPFVKHMVCTVPPQIFWSMYALKAGCICLNVPKNKKKSY